jgi:hypothetical protein
VVGAVPGFAVLVQAGFARPVRSVQHVVVVATSVVALAVIACQPPRFTAGRQDYRTSTEAEPADRGLRLVGELNRCADPGHRLG